MICLFNWTKNNVIIVILIPLVIGLFIFIKNSGTDDLFAEDYYEAENGRDHIQEEKTSFRQHDEKLIIDIKGEVKNPGVYEFQHGDRVNDLIKKAGGLLESADETEVNLAQKLQDEMIIIIPAKGEAGETGMQNNSNVQSDGTVKVNYATQTELETLPGIGPSKAKAIIDYRDEHGFFSQREDLLQVSGIGEKTLQNLEDYIQIP